MNSRLRGRLSECRSVLNSLREIPDARIKCHRVTTSACRLRHWFKLVPLRILYTFAKHLGNDQMQAHSKLHELAISRAIANQIRLPIIDKGHGFTYLARVVHASYAASVIASAALRTTNSNMTHLNQEFQRSCVRPSLHAIAMKLPFLQPPNHVPYHSTLDMLEPETPQQRPEGELSSPYQALHKEAAPTHREDSLWGEHADQTTHTSASVRLRASRNSLFAVGGTRFLTAHPSLESKVSTAVRSIMLRKHLGIPVCDDSLPTGVCPH